MARDLYGLTRDGWRPLTGAFTFGGGDSQAELDEIIRLSLVLWVGQADVLEFAG